MESEKSKRLHVAIIMDGNGRWAVWRGLPRAEGHRAGVAAVRRVLQRALEREVGRLTLYAFSSDNWRRPAAEVQSLFWLLQAYMRREGERLREQGVRFQVIGRRDRLSPEVQCEIEALESSTASARRLHLCLAIDYSSREAITRAAVGLAGPANQRPLSADLVRRALMQNLTAENGEVDLLIRTGGEKRLSDFLLWESAYAELVFTDRMWPDFSEADFDAALEVYSRRERRFGGVPEVVSSV